MGERPDPFRREGLIGRVAPYASITMLAAAMALISVPADRRGWVIAALAITAVIVTSPWTIRWEPLPMWTRAIPPLLYFGVVAMLREAQDGFTALVILPVMWLALHGTRREMAAAIAGVGATILVPYLLFDGARYQEADLRRLALWIGVSAIIGYTTEELVRQSRRQAVEAARHADELEESENRTRRILETAQEAFIAMDVQGRITAWNPAAQQIFGWSEREAIGRELAETIIPAADRTRHRAGLERFLETGEGPVLDRRVELSALHRNGHEFPVELTISPMRTGESYAFNAFLRDIRDRKQFEDQLAANEARFRTLTTSAPVGIFETDADGDCVFVNDRWCELTGMSIEEARGQGWMDAVHPDDRDRVASLWRRATPEGNAFSLEYRFARRRGGEVWVSGQAIAIHAGGAITGYLGTVTDITDSRRMEQELREGRSRLQAILENSPAVMFVKDRRFKYSLVNRKFAELFDVSIQDAVGKSDEDFLAPDVVERVRANDRKVLETGATIEQEEVLTIHGEPRDFTTFKFPLLDTGGKPYAIGGISTDATDRRRAEHERAMLAAIVQAAQEAVIGKSLDGVVTSWNKGAELIYGYTASEAVGRPISFLVPPNVEDDVPRLLEPLRRGEPVAAYETVRRRKDGTLIDVSLSISPVFDESGEPVAAAVLARDITTQKRAQQYFRVQHEVSRALTEAENVEDVIAMVLRALGEGMGWEIGEFWTVDEHAEVLRCAQVWHPPSIDAAEFEAMSRRLEFKPGVGVPGKVWEEGKPIRVVDILDDDNFLPTSVAAKYGLRAAIGLPIRTRDRILGVVVFFTRESKGLDQDLVDMMATVSLHVGQFLERKHAEEEANRLKEEFFSLVSHEFRTPLTSIIGYVQLLLEEGGDALPPAQQRRFLEVVERNGGRLLRLVNDLLLISKVQAGRFSLDPRPVDVDQLARECVEAARPEADAHGIGLTLDGEVAGPISGDPDRLAQLLDNLISNAIKYTPPGERVDVALSKNDDRAVVAVTNTGAYIPPEELDHLFERFYRSSTATSREIPGVGLGLAIAQTIVEAHGGEINAKSTRETGTTFWAELPREPAGNGDAKSTRAREAAA